MQDVGQIRNTVVLGHNNSGKTQLAEALLYTAGAVKRLGKVDDGTATMDFEPEETKRHISINAACSHLTWKKTTVFLVDTPGDDNFFNEAKFAAQVADSAVLTLGAVLGVRPQTRKFVDLVRQRRLPCLVCVTKMDRERADFLGAVEQLREATDLNPVVVHLPIGKEDALTGVVDLLSGTAYRFAADDSGKVEKMAVPDEMADEVAQLRENLMEYVAETDDELIEKFLEEGELQEEELIAGLKAAVAKAEIAPVGCVVPTLNRGTALFLDLMVELLPAPDARPAWVGTKPGEEEVVERQPTADAPFSAQVFKTITDPFAGRLTIFRICSGTLSGDTFYNASKELSERFGHLFLPMGKEQKAVDEAVAGMVVAVAKLKETETGDTLCDAADPIVYPPLEPVPPVISYAVQAKKGDEEKLFSSISRMLDEDPTLQLTREPQTHEVLLSGVGQVHLEVTAEKLKRKFGVEMELKVPKVPYRETLRGKARVQGKHKKQSGGRGQYGDCWIEVEPLPRGGGFEFVDEIVGGVIPQQYRPAVEKGILETMEKGVLAGYPVVDVKVRLVDGSYHTVDSSEMAFKIAGSLAFKKAAEAAGMVLLEPIMEMRIMVDKEHVGDVMGDLNSRRGKVLGMDSSDRWEVITAHVPLAEIQLYALDLTSMTGGTGSFTTSFSHYEEVPAQIAEKVVAAAGEEG